MLVGSDRPSASCVCLHGTGCPSRLSVTLAPQGFSRFVLPAVMAPALAVLLAPFALVAVELSSNAEARAVLAEAPQVGAQLVLGLMALIGLFGWPLLRLVGQAVGRQHITIDRGQVAVRSSGLFGARTWSEPLSGYLAVSHRVRTSLSGVRHEVALLHPRASRSVVLHAGPQPAAEVAAWAAQFLKAAEIPSRIAANVSSAGPCVLGDAPQSRRAAA